MPPAIPDRWLEYSNCGKVIEGTNIICFKVPLKKHVQIGTRHIEEIWEIKALLEKLPDLGGVIDLTNTSRYYDPTEILNAGVKYKKIFMPGRVIPPETSVNEFINTIGDFSEEGKLIGVHCTHGLNRTGYMVCRYLRDYLGLGGNEAIKRFEEARGYKIERENYVDDILGRTPGAPDLGSHTVVKPLRELDSTNQRYRASTRHRKDSASVMDVNRPYDFRYDY